MTLHQYATSLFKTTDKRAVADRNQDARKTGGNLLRFQYLPA
ncbi:hypothetical protein RRSWK_04891 [Rhodopirellula sp. SWK7]|nr:hypothetical protein RRSWK_04891 [Rhodopirellula sp. SWK7]